MKYIFLLYRKVCHASAASILLVAFFVSVVLFSAQVAQGITFSWEANPVEDEIVGYRLYYGHESRFAGGNYYRYIDFSSSESCPADRNGYGCEPLASNAVSCRDLFRENPKCTVNGLPDTKGLYFAMTAYNDQSESEFSQELFSNSISSQQLAGLLRAYSLLLR